MFIRKQKYLVLICAALLAGASGLAAGAASDSAMAPADKQLNALYWQGHDSLKKADWNEAIKRFQDLERRLREKEPASADAALYWQAYALTQAKRGGEAKSAIERLKREFPDSRWSGDADALLRQLEPAPKTAVAAGGDDELAQIAVEGLINAPSERAIPLLKRVLESKHSAKVKKRALFVLSQMDDAAAIDAVLVAARGTDPELRDEAIRMIGVGGQARAIEQLKVIYQGTTDGAVKRTVLQAWLVADRKDMVLQMAKTEADPKLREDAVHHLGAMDAVSELRQLYDASQDAGTQRAVVQALGIANAGDALADIAQKAGNEQVRIEAMHALGVAGAGNRLVGMYASANTPELRRAVVQGLIIADDQKGLVELYRQAKAPEEKKELLRAITTLGNDAALDLIESTLKQ